MDGDVVTTRAWQSAEPEGAVVVSPVVSAGRPVLVTSADPSAHGDPSLWGPIELLAAALSGCLFHAAVDVARRSRVPLVGWTDRVTLTVGRSPPGRRAVRAARVEVVAEVAVGTPLPRARRVLHKAHALCVVAGSLAVPVELALDVRERPSAAGASPQTPPSAEVSDHVV